MFLPYGLHWLPIIVCTVISIIIGMLWFSPLLFAKPWMQLNGLTKEKMRMDLSAWAFVTSIVMAFAIAVVLGSVFQFFSITQPLQGIAVGGKLWIALAGLPMLNHFLYDARPLRLFWIYAFYDLLIVLISGVILSVWR